MHRSLSQSILLCTLCMAPATAAEPPAYKDKTPKRYDLSKRASEIDPKAKDQWGIPVLRFHWKWSDNELRQAAHMHRTFQQIIEAMGGRTVTPVHAENGSQAIYKPGQIIHEVGTTCLGSKPANSVLNPYCQSWDVKNLFVTDGGPFVSNADKNPTLTIMALAWRTCDYLMEEMRKENL